MYYKLPEPRFELWNSETGWDLNDFCAEPQI